MILLYDYHLWDIISRQIWMFHPPLQHRTLGVQNEKIVASCLPGMLYGFRISDPTYQDLGKQNLSDLDFQKIPASPKPEILRRGHDGTFQGKQHQQQQ